MKNDGWSHMQPCLCPKCIPGSMDDPFGELQVWDSTSNTSRKPQTRNPPVRPKRRLYTEQRDCAVATRRGYPPCPRKGRSPLVQPPTLIGYTDSVVCDVQVLSDKFEEFERFMDDIAVESGLLV